MTVLVTGPPAAGVSSLVRVLRERLPAAGVAEAVAEAPAAVVFAVSAIAPLTESDCALLDHAAEATDLVIGVVTKIDLHHRWRDVLAADRDLVGRRAARYAPMPWVGVAAAPESGAARVDELVTMLARRLADPGTAQRNRLRVRAAQAQQARARHDAVAAEKVRHAAAWRRRRDVLRRDARLARAQRGVAVRGRLQQARVELLALTRTRCAALRTELQEEIGDLRRREVGGFEDRVRARAGEVSAGVGEQLAARLEEIASGFGLPCPSPEPAAPPHLTGPPRHTRRLETWLMTVLGAGFGLGVALGVSRLLSGLGPGRGALGMIAGGVVGLLVTAGVVGIRGLLHERAVLDRWVVEVTAALRGAVEQTVATRLLAAETALAQHLLAEQQSGAPPTGEQLANLDARLRDHAAGTARDHARERAVARLARAQDALRDSPQGAVGQPGTLRSGATDE